MMIRPPQSVRAWRPFQPSTELIKLRVSVSSIEQDHLTKTQDCDSGARFSITEEQSSQSVEMVEIRANDFHCKSLSVLCCGTVFADS